jgi:hypothetical protein
MRLTGINFKFYIRNNKGYFKYLYLFFTIAVRYFFFCKLFFYSLLFIHPFIYSDYKNFCFYKQNLVEEKFFRRFLPRSIKNPTKKKELRIHAI